MYLEHTAAKREYKVVLSYRYIIHSRSKSKLLPQHVVCVQDICLHKTFLSYHHIFLSVFGCGPFYHLLKGNMVQRILALFKALPKILEKECLSKKRMSCR